MCNISCIEFILKHANLEEFQDKRILEVGSRYKEGSVQPFIKKFLKPKEYIGIDILPGKFVDMIFPAEKLVEKFGKQSFNVLISTEVIEHVRDWKLVISNFKEILKDEGYLYITTRSKGYQIHGYPYDFWRYEIKDMKNIFKDFEILALEHDHISPGVLIKAKKPIKHSNCDLADISLYSIILNRITNEIPDLKDEPIFNKFKFKMITLIRYIMKIAIKNCKYKVF